MADTGTGILVHAQDACHAEGIAVTAYCGRFLYPQQYAAVVYPLVQRGNQGFILPSIAAAPCAARAACVDDNIYIVRHAVLHIVKVDEFHVHRKPCQRFVDVDKGVHISLMEMAGQRPGAQAAPTVQNRHRQRQGRHGTMGMQLLNSAELVRNIRDILHKIREVIQKVQVAAQADAVDLGPQQGAADMVPILSCIAGGVAARCKGRCTAQAHREQVRMEPQLMHRRINARAHPDFITRKHALDDAVKAEFLKVRAVRFNAHPAIVIKYIGTLAVTVDQIHQFFAVPGHKLLGKLHVIPLVSRRRHVGHLQAALVDKVLCRQGIPILGRKIIQRLFRYGKVIAAPVRKQILVALIAAPDPDEVIEHTGKPHHVGLGVGLAPIFQPVVQKVLSFLGARINRQQVLTGPAVGNMVVHVDLFPGAPCQKADRVSMEQHWTCHSHCTCGSIPLPCVRRQQLVGRAVPNLPVTQGFGAVIDLELLIKEPRHRLNGQRLFGSNDRLCAQKGLL